MYCSNFRAQGEMLGSVHLVYSLGYIALLGADNFGTIRAWYHHIPLCAQMRLSQPAKCRLHLDKTAAGNAPETGVRRRQQLLQQ